MSNIPTNLRTSSIWNSFRLFAQWFLDDVANKVKQSWKQRMSVYGKRKAKRWKRFLISAAATRYIYVYTCTCMMHKRLFNFLFIHILKKNDCTKAVDIKYVYDTKEENSQCNCFMLHIHSHIQVLSSIFIFIFSWSLAKKNKQKSFVCMHTQL